MTATRTGGTAHLALGPSSEFDNQQQLENDGSVLFLTWNHGDNKGQEREGTKVPEQKKKREKDEVKGKVKFSHLPFILKTLGPIQFPSQLKNVTHKNDKLGFLK